MNCETTRTLMSEYIDGILPPDQTTAFRAHLAGCPDCRRDLAALEKTVALVKNIKMVEPPENLVQAVHARLEAGEKPRSLWTIAIFQPALAIAAGLVLVLGIGAYFLLEHGRRQAGFTVASVEQKHVVKDEKIDRDQASFSARDEKPAKDEAVISRLPGRMNNDSAPVGAGLAPRPEASERAQPAPMAQKPQAAMDSMSVDNDARQNVRLENATRALPSQDAMAGSKAKVGWKAGNQPAASAPPSAGAETKQTAEIMDEAAATRFAAASGGGRGGAEKPSSITQPIINLTVATSNRAAVERILLAYDARPPAKKARQERLLKAPAEKSDRTMTITLPVSRVQDLLTQLKSKGKISVADQDRPTVSAPDKMKAEGDMSTIAIESGGLLTVNVTITSP